jgi:SAM-dependent methyltransferase
VTEAVGTSAASRQQAVPGAGAWASGGMPAFGTTAAAAAFDGMADAYDATFSSGAIGTLLRQAVWRRLDARFAAGDRVLEIGCGTGEDAVHLAGRGVRVLATDTSARMLEVARAKVDAAGLAGAVEIRRFDVEELGAPDAATKLRSVAPPVAGATAGTAARTGTAPGTAAGAGTTAWTAAGFGTAAETAAGAGTAAGTASGAGTAAGTTADAGTAAGTAAGAGTTADAAVEANAAAVEKMDGAGGAPFDGAFSNFGALNCVADLRGVATGLARCLRPGAMVVLCLMGPLVPWEWLWFFGHGQPANAFRRLRPGGARWRGLTVRYPSIHGARRALAPAFRLRRAAAVGALLPPSYVERWAVRHPVLLRRLDRWERRVETWPPLPWLADHYLLELERC